jgi:hypothetical protein
MPAGIVSFDFDKLVASDLAQTAGLARTDIYAKGVFSEFPASTPKYANRDIGGTEPDYRESMARMFIQLQQQELTRFIASIDHEASDAGEAKILASVLAGSGGVFRGTGYIDFLLQNVEHAFEEKAQTVETLADNYVVYYFGAAAVPWVFSGALLNTREDDQAMNMLRMYQTMLRGTQLAKRRKLVSLRFNNMIVSGSIMNLHMGLTADNESVMPFNFQLLPKTVTLLPSLEFGVVILQQAAEDPAYIGTSNPGSALTSGRFEPASPATILGGGGTQVEPTDEENEAQTSFSSGQTLLNGTSTVGG